MLCNFIKKGIKTMPNIIVHATEGLPPEQKKNMVKRITEYVSKDVDLPVEDVRIIITEHPTQNVAIGGEFLSEKSNTFYPLVFVGTKAGKTDELLKTISSHIADAIAEAFEYPADRIRVYFIERKIS